MVDNELSLIKFCTMNYWALLLNSPPLSPITTKLLKIVESIINAEEKPDKKILKRLEWLYNNTHEHVEDKLTTVEFLVFRNINKGINFEIDLQEGVKVFYLYQLYHILDQVTQELTRIVVEVSKKYTLDIPLIQYGSQNTKQEFNI